MVKLAVALLLLGLLSGCQMTPPALATPIATAILPSGDWDIPFETIALDDGKAMSLPLRSIRHCLHLQHLQKRHSSPKLKWPSGS